MVLGVPVGIFPFLLLWVHVPGPCLGCMPVLSKSSGIVPVMFSLAISKLYSTAAAPQAFFQLPDAFFGGVSALALGVSPPALGVSPPALGVLAGDVILSTGVVPVQLAFPPAEIQPQRFAVAPQLPAGQLVDEDGLVLAGSPAGRPPGGIRGTPRSRRTASTPARPRPA